MQRRPILASGLLASILVVAWPGAAAPASPVWPTRWQVNGNGDRGRLEFTIDERGVLAGRLSGEPVEGFVSGRHLFLRRHAGDRTELWEGWLSAETAGDEVIVAGSISVDEDGETRVYPWYGTPAATVEPADEAEPFASTPRVEGAAGPLSGTWTTLAGERIEIAQERNRLIVVLPDGSAHSGRVTGGSSLVVGLRKGCCNGKLESPDVIVWSDGARWQRAD